MLSGKARQMSKSFFAEIVVASSAPTGVLIDNEICISKSVAVNTNLSLFASNNRLERIGSVWRLSTILLTEESGFNNVSRFILMFHVKQIKT